MDNTLRTLQKKRTANFREDETKLLIQLWGSPSIQNKLFLTHRKAPVMRLLAANMQQRGFYRTPDEIKTRIRNLKCLYHRIKRSMSCGTGIGTVDPDWPHFKAMDEILSKEYPRKLTDRIVEELDGSTYEEVQVKQEVDDVDIDDNESWATNESLNSEYDEESQQSDAPMVINKPTPPPLTFSQAQSQGIQVKRASTMQAQPLKIQLQPTAAQAAPPKPHIPIQPAPAAKAQAQSQPQPQPTIMPTFQLPTGQVSGAAPAAKGSSIPFPLLILNNLNHPDKNGANRASTMANNGANNDAVTQLLKELVDLQKESIAISKEKMEIEKQRLEFDRLIGTQLITLTPMLGGLIQRLAYPGNQDQLDLKFDVETGVKRKRSSSEDAEIAKDSNILRNMLEQGMRKYLVVARDEEEDNGKEDGGIPSTPMSPEPVPENGNAPRIEVDKDMSDKSDNGLEVDEDYDPEKQHVTVEDVDDDDDKPLVIETRQSMRNLR